MDDGLFEVLLVRMPRNINQLQNIILDLMNKNVKSEMFVYTQASNIKFNSAPMGWSLDGEFGGVEENVEIKNWNKAVPIIGSDKEGVFSER